MLEGGGREREFLVLHEEAEHDEAFSLLKDPVVLRWVGQAEGLACGGAGKVS